MKDKIIIKGARTHNLKNISVEIPRNKMVVFTGLSGSGKSSLAFDTIFAEGQRKYVESLSAYARQFLRQMQKPDVEEILESVMSIVEVARKQKVAGVGKLTKGVSSAKVRISSPVVVGRKGEYYQLLYDLLNKGFEKVVVDGADKS